MTSFYFYFAGQNGDLRSPKRPCTEYRGVLLERNSFTSPVKDRLLALSNLKSKLPPPPLQSAFARYQSFLPGSYVVPGILYLKFIFAVQHDQIQEVEGKHVQKLELVFSLARYETVIQITSLRFLFWFLVLFFGVMNLRESAWLTYRVSLKVLSLLHDCLTEEVVC